MQRNMKALCSFALLAALSLPLTALAGIAPKGDPSAMTGTVKVGSTEMALEHVLLTPKKDYVHVLVDIFPYRTVLNAESVGPDSLSAVAKVLATDVVLPRLPKSKKAKVEFVEFPENDVYGAPRWDAIKRIAKFEVTLSKKKVAVKKL